MAAMQCRGEPLSRQDEIIRASEVSLYTFCARAWWLGQVLGHRSATLAAMQRGTAQHRAHGRRVASFHRLRRVAIGLFALAGVALAVWLLVAQGQGLEVLGVPGCSAAQHSGFLAVDPS